jgi:hypothetical protein
VKAAGRAVAAALLGGLLGAVCAALFYAWDPSLVMEFDRTPPRLVSGIYGPEHDERFTVTFAWTGPDVSWRVPGLDRRVDWTLHMRVRGARPSPADNPDISIFADGVELLTHHTVSDFEDLDIVIPAQPQHRRGLAIAIRTSRTFVPGPSDSRALGVMLDRLALTPSGAVRPPRAALAGAGLCSAWMGAAVALLGVTAGSAIGAAVLLSAGSAGVIARGFGPFTTFPWAASRMALWIAIALVVLSLFVQRVRGESLRNTAKFAAAFSASALLLKLLVLLHPDMRIGDALFHAHRFQRVLAGDLYFTSVAPGGYSFPYPPGFYLFASLFSGLVRRGAADVTLLRVIACSVDVIAGLLLYRAMARAWGDRLAGAIGVALYQLVPIDFTVLTTGNLTNAFAQSLAVGGLVVMASPAVRFERVFMTAGLAAVLLAAYLSHTSTLAILFVATLAAAILFLLRGGPALRSPAAAIAAASVGAAVIAVLVYYSHFFQTYQSELSRLSRETTTAAPDAGGRGIIDRLAMVPYYLRIDFGLPLLALTAIGAWRMASRGAADRLTLIVWGWMLACALFLLVGILTPLDMRYYLAAIPAVAIIAAVGASRGWDGGLEWRAATGVLLAAAAIAGMRNWWNALN